MTGLSSKTALVVGATGLVGDIVARMLVESPAYEKVKVLVRKSLGWQHPRLQETIFDFDYPNGLLVQADDIFCCLGTTIKKAGSQDAFRKVDYQYPMSIARLGLANGARQFGIVTAMGADAGSRIFYNRVKGEVERDLMTLDYPTLLIYRPSLLVGNRQESRLGEKIGEGFMKLFNPLIPAKYKAIDAQKVARAMVNTMQLGLTDTHIYTSDQLQRF